jgi:hypothetical protein
MGEFQIFGIRFIYVIMVFSLLTSGSAYAQITVYQKDNDNYVALMDDDVPDWEVGYSWTYRGEIQISENINLYLDMNEASFVVSEKDDGLYKLILGGDVTGSVDVPNTPFSFEIQELRGNILLMESNLGLKETELFISGKVRVEAIRYPAEASFKFVYSQPRDYISYPLYVGKSWVIPECETSISIKIKMLGIPFYSYNFVQTAPGVNRTCLSYDEIISGGNIYYAYKIFNGVSSNLSYAPSIGNMLMIESEGKTIIELFSTSYPSPDNPQKPDKPTGPNKCKTDVEYTYITKTIDPNQDDIKYGWDWDGDMFVDLWTDYHNSNVTISITHIWTKEGAFNLQVKARDPYGHESDFSDHLAIDIPRARYHSILIDMPIFEELIHFLI